MDLCRIYQNGLNSTHMGSSINHVTFISSQNVRNIRMDYRENCNGIKYHKILISTFDIQMLY